MPKKIPKEVLLEILDCARLAPTAINIQPWEFIVVTDSSKLVEISELTDYGRFIKDCAACIVVACKDEKYYLEDGSAATENILLAAESLGIGSCWVAGDKKEYAKDVLQLLEVPEGYKLVSMVPLGYYQAPAGPPGKRELNSMVHWEKF